MIGTLTMSYYLDENTYNAIREMFALSKDNRKKQFENNPITGISTLDLHYEKWGRVYFFDTIINLNKLYGTDEDILVSAEKIDNQSFYELLTKAYKKTFGTEITDGIQKRERFYCTYIEYIVFMKTNDAYILMNELKKGTFTNEQLDINCYDSYRLKNAYVSFTINQINKQTVRLCAKCPNTILKKIFKIEGLDEDGNIPHTKINQALNKEMAAEIFYKQVVKFTKPNIPLELSKKNILSAL